MKISEARQLADELLTQLGSACVRLEIAGSIRRRKADVGDIELVAIPSVGEYQVEDLFGPTNRTITVNYLDDSLAALYLNHEWQLDHITKRDGAKYKRLRHIASGLCCDLFITDARRWGYTFTVRTGPGEFSKALVSRALIRKQFFKDGLLHSHPPIYNDKREVDPCPSGERCLRIIPTLEERDVFSALGLAYIEPIDRTLEAITRPVPAR